MYKHCIDQTNAGYVIIYSRYFIRELRLGHRTQMIIDNNTFIY